VVRAPEHPLVLVVGGVKVRDKLPLLQHFLDHVDTICLGGVIALAFLEARGDVPEEARVCDEETVGAARALLAETRERGVELRLPVDAVIAPSEDALDRFRTVAVTEMPPGWAFLDIGPDTIRAFEAALTTARTVIWNGPLGRFEVPPFDRGTVAIAEALARLDAMTVVGGGETAAAVRRCGLADRMWHISTGGGAALAFLGGRSLPGLQPLYEREAAPRAPSHLRH
jgi:phosphoglycerate kinase